MKLGIGRYRGQVLFAPFIIGDQCWRSGAAFHYGAASGGDTILTFPEVSRCAFTLFANGLTVHCAH